MSFNNPSSKVHAWCNKGDVPPFPSSPSSSSFPSSSSSSPLKQSFWEYPAMPSTSSSLSLLADEHLDETRCQRNWSGRWTLVLTAEGFPYCHSRAKQCFAFYCCVTNGLDDRNGSQVSAAECGLKEKKLPKNHPLPRNHSRLIRTWVYHC